MVTKSTVRDGITQTLAYAYNKADQLTQLTYPDGRSVAYSRNALGQVTAVTTRQGGTTVTLAGNVGYEPFGPVKAMSYGNGIDRTQSYDQDYRLTAMTSGVLDRAYTYDAANNITAITNNLDSSRSQTFSYDALNRLTDAGGIYGAFTYTYDADGNRLTKSTAGGVEGYTYDTASNRLLQVQDGGTRDYQYDANGNTVDNTDHQFVYGDNNRLQEAQTSGLSLAAYTYNGRGERVKKAGTAMTYYEYGEQGQLLAETDGAGNTLRDYVYLNGRTFAVIVNDSTYFIHADQFGTPQVMTGQNQKVEWQADYQPFGQASILTEDITNNLRFLGQYYDAETDNNYNYFRNYESSTGRYIQSDLIGLIGGNNIYLYANANPLKFIDIYGLASFNFLKDLMRGLTKKFSDLGGSIGESAAGDTGGNSLGKKCSKYFCGLHVINPPPINIHTECLMLDTANTFDIGYGTVGSCVEDCKKRTHSKDFAKKCLSKTGCNGNIAKPTG